MVSYTVGSRESSVGWLPMYWILDKGYLFSVAYLQHWKWSFIFKTILAAYGTTKALI